MRAWELRSYSHEILTTYKHRRDDEYAIDYA